MADRPLTGKSIVNTNQVPTDVDFIRGARGDFPPPVFRKTDFWAHGLSVGLAIGW